MSRKPHHPTLFDEDGNHSALHDVVEALHSTMGIPKALVSVETHASQVEPGGECDVVVCTQAPGIRTSFALNPMKAEKLGLALITAAARATIVTASMRAAQAPAAPPGPEPTATQGEPPKRLRFTGDGGTGGGAQ